MVTIWSLYRGGGAGGGHLPQTGGTMDQPAIMMDALQFMNHVFEGIKDGAESSPSR